MIAPNSPDAQTASFDRGALCDPGPRSEAPSATQRAIKKLSITTRQEDERQPDMRPLDLALTARLIGYMRPYARRRNVLIAMVVLRSIQLPLIAWTIAAIINGPISRHELFPFRAAENDKAGPFRRAG